MKKKLFVFFMLIVLLCVIITAYISYDYTKKWIINNTRENLKTESLLVEEYIKIYSSKLNYNDIAHEIKDKTGKRVTIIKQDGTVIGESDPTGIKIENHKNRLEIEKALSNGEGDSIRFSTTENYPMYYFAKKFKIDSSIYIIRLAVKLDYIKKIQYNYLKFIILSIFIGMCISSILVYFYLNIIIQRIKKLRDATYTIASGQYDKRISIDSKDELGNLGNTFNLMADRLEETIEDLMDKKNKLISVLTSMEDGVIVVDKDENIILINPTAKKLFSINEDVIGRHFIEVIRNYDLEDIIKNKLEDVELCINHPNMIYLRIKTANVVNSDKHSENIGLMMVMHDITKIKKLEKMRSEFVANVSHELKTPLTSIKGFAETLKVVEEKEIRDKFLDIIYVESERLTRLINDILSLSELESKDLSVKFEKINIRESLSEVYEIMKIAALNKKINLSLSSCEGDTFVDGDRDKFKQMMINLIDNSIKYTNEGGHIEILSQAQEDHILISVRDNGIGIPEVDLPRLFERFYRIDKARTRSVGGTGLGLAIVKHIVMIFNGSIKVKSRVGEGTEFTINLPKVQIKELEIENL